MINIYNDAIHAHQLHKLNSFPAKPVFNRYGFSYKANISKNPFCFGHFVQKLLNVLKAVKLILVVAQTSVSLHIIYRSFRINRSCDNTLLSSEKILGPKTLVYLSILFLLTFNSNFLVSSKNSSISACML